MADPFEEIDAVYQAIGRDLFGRDELRDVLRTPSQAPIVSAYRTTFACFATQAASSFPDGVPTDQSARLEKWEAIAERPSVDERLEQLDERWYALSETLEQRLHTYARTRIST